MSSVQKVIKAGALPVEFRTDFPNPDEEVRVEVSSAALRGKVRREAWGDLLKTMDQMSQEAAERGLTPEILQEILDEK